MSVSDVLLVSNNIREDSLTSLGNWVDGLLDNDWLWNFSLGLILNDINNFSLFGDWVDIHHNGGLLFSVSLNLDFVGLSIVSD